VKGGGVAGPDDQAGGSVASGGTGGGRRGWPATPLGARLFGAALAVLGVTLLVLGLVTLRGKHPDNGRPGAAPSRSVSASASPATTAPGSSTAASTTPGGASSPAATPSTSAPASSPPSSSRPPAKPRAPLTVLNNSKIKGLGEQAAGQAERQGWRVADVGNFAGRIPVTTIYFNPGDAAGERAAQEFAAEFPAVQRVFPRYAGLPPTPPGIVLVVTRDWVN
jgi:hypothetical protein